ncbi:MAG: hypothetical protein ACF8PN_14990 [Phycisphaerales bacterium]
MGLMVIAAYRPKPGKKDDLLAVVREHMPTLRRQGLVTDRAAVTMEARDGTIVEVFEWKSSDAVDRAHEDPVVRAMWDRFFEACECVPLARLDESSEMFAHFAPLKVDP